MTYEQMTSLAEVQRRQLMIILGAFFVAMVGAILFSAFLITNMMRQAHALGANNPGTVRIITAADTSSCSVPGGGAGGGESAAAANEGGAGGAGGGVNAAALTGGKGGGLGGAMITGGTFSWTISRNVNSGNNYGSFNGGNSSTVNNTQGSYNTVSGKGAELNQLNLAKNDADTTTVTKVDKSGNTIDSNNNTDVDVTKTTTVNKDSNNTNSGDGDQAVDNLVAPLPYVGVTSS